MAGALGIELGGAAYYDGELEMRSTFGSGMVPVSVDTLRQARKIMWFACGCTALILFAARLGVIKLMPP
jgi:adenosylcobinamide-phosphate synthase